MAINTETASASRAFLTKIGALYEPEEFEALLDRDLVEKLARANPGLYGTDDLAAAASRPTERRAFMSPASSTGSDSDLMFELELENVLDSFANLSFS